MFETKCISLLIDCTHCVSIKWTHSTDTLHAYFYYIWFLFCYLTVFFSLDFRNDTALGQSLLGNPIFKSFCARLMKIVRLLEPQDLLVTYKTFCTLEVRNNTYLMQCVLKMIGAHLNNMTIGQLTFLNFLLYKQRHNPLVDGLRLALPLVLQVQIDQQLDSNNLKEVVNCLQLSCRSALKPATIQVCTFLLHFC